MPAELLTKIKVVVGQGAGV